MIVRSEYLIVRRARRRGPFRVGASRPQRSDLQVRSLLGTALCDTVEFVAIRAKLELRNAEESGEAFRRGLTDLRLVLRSADEPLLGPSFLTALPPQQVEFVI